MKKSEINRQLNQLRLTLHHNLKGNSTRIRRQEIDINQDGSLLYTRGAVSRLNEIVEALQNKFLQDGQKVYENTEIEKIVNRLLFSKVSQNIQITSDELSELISNMKEQSTITRYFIFPLLGVRFQNDPLEFQTPFSCYVSGTDYLKDSGKIFNYEQTQLELFKHSRTCLVVGIKGPKNQLTYFRAKYAANKLVNFLNAQDYRYQVQIISPNSIENSVTTDPQEEHYQNLSYVEFDNGSWQTSSLVDRDYTPCDLIGRC